MAQSTESDMCNNLSVNDSESCQLLICGDGGVGKTALSLSFTTGQYIQQNSYEPTIINQYQKSGFEVDGKSTTVYIYDVQGQEEYTDLRIDTISNSDAFILVYSITSQSTFDVLQQWIKEIKQTKLRLNEYEGIPWILVAMKSDLEPQRQVSKEKGQKLAKVLKCPFFEAYITNNSKSENIQQIFESAVSESRKYKTFSVNNFENKKKRQNADKRVSVFINKMFKKNSNNNNDNDDDDENNEDLFIEIFGDHIVDTDDDTKDVFEELKKIAENGQDVNVEELLEIISTYDYPENERINVMRKINGNLGLNKKYDGLLQCDTMPLLLCGYAAQIIDKKSISVQHRAIISIANIFAVCLEKGSTTKLVIGSLQKILDNLCKIYDDEECKTNDERIIAAVDTIIDVVIEQNNYKGILVLSGILTEILRPQNTATAKVRKFIMKQLIKIMFPKENITFINDILENKINKININDLPMNGSSHRDWLDICIEYKHGPENTKNIGDEYRNIISDAVSQCIIDIDNQQIGLNIANIMYQLNSNWKKKLNSPARNCWIKQVPLNKNKKRISSKKYVATPAPKKPLPSTSNVEKKHDDEYDDYDGLSLKRIRFKEYFFQISKYGTKTQIYYNQFVKYKYDDLQIILTFIDNIETLQNDIGMNSVDSIYFIKNIQKLDQENKKFQEFFVELNMTEYYKNIFLNILGIMVFEQFCETFKTLQSLIDVIGEENKNDAETIWNNLPKNVINNDCVLCN